MKTVAVIEKTRSDMVVQEDEITGELTRMRGRGVKSCLAPTSTLDNLKSGRARLDPMTLEIKRGRPTTKIDPGHPKVSAK